MKRYLSDAQFKTLGIRMLTEDGSKIKGQVKAMKSEIKENIQGTNSDGKETGTQNQQVGAEGTNKHSTRIE